MPWRRTSTLHGPGWAHRLTTVPAAAAYATTCKQLSATRPALLAAHVYVRYLGDLNGGQMLSRIVAKGLGWPRCRAVLLRLRAGRPGGRPGRGLRAGAGPDRPRRSRCAGAGRRGLQRLRSPPRPVRATGPARRAALTAARPSLHRSRPAVGLKSRISAYSAAARWVEVSSSSSSGATGAPSVPSAMSIAARLALVRMAPSSGSAVAGRARRRAQALAVQGQLHRLLHRLLEVRRAAARAGCG
jgi:hypothetical protein